MRRKICVVTTSRADLGHLTGLMQAIQEDEALRLQVIASGMHLSKRFGETWRDIEAAGFRIDRKISMPWMGDSGVSNARAVGRGVTVFAEALAALKTEIVVLLGDRFELLAPATAALLLRIPIAHLHGGELTEGAIDDAVRHALTKMASLHFPATEAYRKRIIQMGEAPGRVFNFGAPGLDALHGFVPMSRQELERDLGLSLEEPAALVTWHPVTRDAQSADAQMRPLLRALEVSGLNAVFTAANADAGGARINQRLRSLCARNPRRFRFVPHLGHRRYLSCLARFAVMVGNSSSGLTEAPSFRLPVVNIGDRQRGRVRAANVIDVPCSERAIRDAVRRALSPRFRSSLRGMNNPYDRFHDGRVSRRISAVLKKTKLDSRLLMKEFHDIG